MPILKRPLKIIFIVILLSVACLQLYLLKSFEIDDAYISYRYARNLAAGKGLVFNEGERLEGFSNPLWVFFLAPFSRLDLAVAARISGVLFSLASLLILALYFPPIFGSSVFLLAPLFLSLNAAFLLWGLGGLETSFYGFLLILAISLFLKEGQTGKFYCSALIFSLVALTRPEGIIYYLPTIFFKPFFNCQRGKTWWRRKDWYGVLIFFAIFGLFFLSRFFYYGEWLPNTYYAKSGGLELYLKRGINYLKVFFDNYGYFTFALFPVLSLFSKRNRLINLYLFAILLSGLAFTVYAGGDWMPEYRFLIPLLPVWYLLIASGICNLNLLIKQRFAENKILNILAILVVSVVIIFNHAENRPRTIRRAEYYGHAVMGMKGLGLWLNKTMPASTVLAADDCGALPYQAGFYTVDSRGLLDKHIGRLKIADFYLKYDVDYLLNRQPDLIEIQLKRMALTRRDLKPVPGFPLPTYKLIPGYTFDYYAKYAPWPGARALLKHPEFQKKYQPKLIFTYPNSVCYVVIFERLL